MKNYINNIIFFLKFRTQLPLMLFHKKQMYDLMAQIDL